MSPVELASSLSADLRVLLRLLRGQPRQGSHAERLTAFYGPQADRYDHFRARLLHGREELLKEMDIPAGARFVELGCGTGSNLEMLAALRPLPTLAQADLVDLCPPLLAVARHRTRHHPNVMVHEADATRWRPSQPVDRVLLAYALTMMPDWRGVLDNAWSMLAPGGRLGVVDFHLPESGGRLANSLWRRWFAHDGVHLGSEHTRALRSLGAIHYYREARAPVPYLPGLRAPYYLYVGVKP